MKPTRADLTRHLQGYLYDYLLGKQRNQSFIHGMADRSLPRDIVKSVADLQTVTSKVFQQQIDQVEGNILVAQTAQLLNPEIANKALAILDQIRES